eukprot:scaffold10624_cov41-Prasinocladus_malaysianus.AAC.1
MPPSDAGDKLPGSEVGLRALPQTGAPAESVLRSHTHVRGQNGAPITVIEDDDIWAWGLDGNPVRLAPLDIPYFQPSALYNLNIRRWGWTASGSP